jgi:regulatory protein YycI of two-component signal transduction system YycFG
MSIFKRFWKKYNQIIILVTIIILAIFIGFRFGQVNANNNTKINVSVNNLKNANQAQEKINLATEALERQGIDLKVGSMRSNVKDSVNKKDCLFVASRKSHKYHTAECKYGKNIKLANRICFKSQEEAKTKGFVPAKGCLKNNSKKQDGM